MSSSPYIKNIYLGHFGEFTVGPLGFLIEIDIYPQGSQGYSIWNPWNTNMEPI